MRRALFPLAVIYAALFVAALGLRWATRTAQLHAIEGA